MSQPTLHASVTLDQLTFTWPDGSLGCAEPGRLYTQELVPGYRLVAKASAGELVYHTDQRGQVASCPGQPRKPARKELGGRPPVEPVTGKPPQSGGL